MKNQNASNSRRLAVFLSIAMLGSVFLSGCSIDSRTAIEKRIDATTKPVVVVTCNPEGSLLRAADGSVIMVPGDLYIAKTMLAQGLKPGDVLVP